jgi:hypothetical protein
MNNILVNFLFMSSLLKASQLGLQPKRPIYYRQKVKTGLCLRNFGQPNEQQRHFNE